MTKSKPNINGRVYYDKESIDIAVQSVGLPIWDEQRRVVGVVTGSDDKVMTAKITDKRLAEEVLNGGYQNLSMGCQISRTSVCSICSKSEQADPLCSHLQPHSQSLPVSYPRFVDWTPPIEYPPADQVSNRFDNIVFSVVDADNLIDPAYVIKHTNKDE